ncbi:MAG: DUF4111 domain-containing protein [Clostridia bacterium]|nr:DUF4111 domain-containing protein [Clostridia bacterium]
MGCFNPAKSDLDLIVVAERPLSDAEKRALMDSVVTLNAEAPAKGIEMSVVLREVCRPFVYPTPFELHFSVAHLAWYREDPEDYIRRMNGTDKDLAAHFTVLRARGVCLAGAPVREVFAEVPARDYLDALLYDVADAAEEIAGNPMYLTLNLARVLAWREEGLVLSKKEGGEWALRRLPAEYHPLLRNALREYAESADPVYDPALAGRYAEYMLQKILPPDWFPIPVRSKAANPSQGDKSMPKNDNPHALRFLDSMKNHGEQAAGERFAEAHPLSRSAGAQKKFEWAKDLCAFLETSCEDEKTQAIRGDCACGPGRSTYARIRALYREAAGPLDFVEKTNRLDLGFTLEYDGTSYFLVYPQCYCSFVKRIPEPLPRTWCYCTLGYTRRMFGFIFDREVRAELLSSVKQSDPVCRIRITLA